MSTSLLKGQEQEVRTSSEQQSIAMELASNGTSFDGFLRQMIAENGSESVISSLVNRSAEDNMIKAVSTCMTPVGKAFAPIQCDFGLAAAYEVCQALPEASFICLSPTIGNYLASQNITDGQTDKMAWSYFGNIEQFGGNFSSTD